MFYDIPVQRCTCLPVLADPIFQSLCHPDLHGDGLQRGAFPASIRSPWRTGCSSNTTKDIATFYRVGRMRPLPSRRLAMYYLEHPGVRWICFLQTKDRESKTHLSQKLVDHNNIICLQGGAWKRMSTFTPENENAGRSGHLYSQGHPT